MKWAALVSGLLAAVVLAGCGAATGDGGPGDPRDAAPAGIGGANDTKKIVGTRHVGETIRLLGLSSDDKTLKVAVTVTKVVRVARPRSRFLAPEKGQRLLAVRVRLKNVGTAMFRDSPENCATAIDAQDNHYTASLVATRAGRGFNAKARIAPGKARQGFITFEVPKTVRIKKIQFTLNSGFADQTGEWMLTK